MTADLRTQILAPDPLRVQMITAGLDGDFEDLPEGPAVILVGETRAVGMVGKMMFRDVCVVERAAYLAALDDIARLRTLLARNLVMDLGSGEEAADLLGGLPAVFDLVAQHHEARAALDDGQ